MPRYPLRPEDYEVGWICAVTVEYVIACELLDEEYPPLPSISPRDNNAYTFGRIANHNIVISCLPKGKYGISSAATVARDLLRSFPSIRFGLMVGIAGGAPSKNNDIRLGDIVVAAPEGRSGGVVYYEFGKAIQGHGFERTGMINPPSPFLLSALNQIIRVHASSGHQIDQKVAELLQKNPRLVKTYQKPSSRSDRLFKSSFVHPTNFQSCEEFCRTQSHVRIHRAPRSVEDDDPKVHYGLIASADHLMKDARIRDSLSETEGILCFEMEAAGLMDQFPFLVIRGICDYCDTHKNDVWQGYAAAVASAYTKELLCLITPLNSSHSQDQEVELSSRANKIKDLTDILHVVDHHHLLTSVTKAHPGTGDWLLKSDSFQKWAGRGKESLLWLATPPGYGKTVLTRHLIESLREGNESLHELTDLRKSAVVYHFFREKDREHGPSLSLLIKSILYQLLTIFPDLYDTITYGFEKEPYKKKSRSGEVSWTTMWDTLISVLQTNIVRRLVIIVEALDEADLEDLGDILFQLARVAHRFSSVDTRRYVKLFVTSRPHKMILDQFCEPYVKLVEPSQDNLVQAVGQFIDEVVSEFCDKHEFPEDVTSRIKYHLRDNSDGMFLWASLAWEHFKEGVVIWTQGAIDMKLKALEQLPPGLETLYEKLMLTTAGAVKKDLRALFIAIAAAPRPLTCKEAGILLSIQNWHTATTELDIPFSIKTAIRRNCPNLVKIDKDELITFVHLSLRDFLLKWLKMQTGEIHLELASRCLNYLSFQDVQRTAVLDLQHAGSSYCLMKETYAFYNYAATNLKYHLDLMADNDELWIKYSKLVENYPAFHVASLPDHYLHVNHFRKPPDFYAETPLRHLLRTKRFGLIRQLAQNGYNLNERVFYSTRWIPGDGETALHSCIEDEECVSLLLELGCSPDVQSQDGSTPLHLAVLWQNYSIVQKLLSIPNINVNARDMRGRTPAHLEVSKGQAWCLIFDHRVDLSITDNDGRSPLSFAAFWGDAAMVAKLIEVSRASLGVEEGAISPLIAAAAQEWEEITMKMIKIVSDINEHRGLDGKTILHWAVINNWPDVLNVAIAESNADVNAVDNVRKTALHYAAELGVPKAVRTLLRFGASARIQDAQGRTAVQTAAVQGFADTLMPLILDSDFDVNDMDKQKRTLVHWAASCDWLSIMNSVVDQPNVDMLRLDFTGRNALHIAAICGCPTVLRFLIELQIYDINKTDAFGNTALHLAARGKSLSAAEVLLAQPNLHLHRINQWGQTALDTAATYSAEAVVFLLKMAGLRFQSVIDPVSQVRIEAEENREQPVERPGCWTLVTRDEARCMTNESRQPDE